MLPATAMTSSPWNQHSDDEQCWECIWKMPILLSVVIRSTKQHQDQKDTLPCQKGLFHFLATQMMMLGIKVTTMATAVTTTELPSISSPRKYRIVMTPLTCYSACHHIQDHSVLFIVLTNLIQWQIPLPADMHPDYINIPFPVEFNIVAPGFSLLLLLIIIIVVVVVDIDFVSIVNNFLCCCCFCC